MAIIYALINAKPAPYLGYIKQLKITETCLVLHSLAFLNLSGLIMSKSSFQHGELDIQYFSSQLLYKSY